MTIKQLIKQLQKLDKDPSVKKNIMCASDEEWNNIYTNINIQIDGHTNRPVIYGLDGSQEKNN